MDRAELPPHGYGPKAGNLIPGGVQLLNDLVRSASRRAALSPKWP
jgi:hypothetical protein